MKYFHVAQNGSITFDPPTGSEKPYTLDFGNKLICAVQQSNGVVLKTRDPDGLEKRAFDGGCVWVVDTKGLQIAVSEDDRTVTIEDKARLLLQGRLRCLTYDGMRFYACVYPEGTIGGRNLFAYGSDGGLLWQVGQRPWKPEAMLTYAEVLQYDGLLHAASGPNDLGIIVSRETGEVLDRYDIR